MRSLAHKVNENVAVEPVMEVHPTASLMLVRRSGEVALALPTEARENFIHANSVIVVWTGHTDIKPLLMEWVAHGERPSDLLARLRASSIDSLDTVSITILDLVKLTQTVLFNNRKKWHVTPAYEMHTDTKSEIIAVTPTIGTASVNALRLVKSEVSVKGGSAKKLLTKLTSAVTGVVPEDIIMYTINASEDKE